MDGMIEIIISLILGLLIGVTVAWIIGSAYRSKKIAEIEGRARSAEAVQNEIRQQLERKESEIRKISEELNNERQEKVKAITELETSLKNLEEQKQLLETMKEELSNTFKALSSAALKSSSEDFLKLASEHLGKIVADAKGKLGEHKEAMNSLLKPLQEALKRYEEQIQEMEKNRARVYGSLEEQIKSLSSASQQLQQETSNLVTALRKPQISGSWGQLSLRRAAELSGMTAYCDFYEEVSVETETGRLRPDMIVRLPNGREIVVDAKAPVDAYLKAVSVASEEEQKRALNDYVNQVRSHMNRLGSKSYWDQFPKSPEMVVMYLPGESFFSVALEHDYKLIEDSALKRVILATPTTFIALLKAIAYGWQQEQMTKNAQRISELGRELYDRINTLVKHFDDLGTALAKAIASYNKAIGSMESRVLPSIRKFKELGVTTSAGEIPELEQIDQTTRNLSLIKAEPNTDSNNNE
jgi:DNA recombination protein RmuC